MDDRTKLVSQPKRARSGLSEHLADHLRVHATEITRAWVAELERQSPGNGEGRHSAETLLDRIPRVLERVAAFVADAEVGLLEASILDDLGGVADARRRQGYGLQEVLREHHLLSTAVQESIEAAVAGFTDASAVEAVRVVGRVREAIHLLSAVTIRSFHSWEARYNRERAELLETFGQVINHELGNRLGAAETAATLLRSGVELSDDRRAQLHDLIIDGIQGGMETIRDLSVLAQPTSETSRTSGVPLRLLVSESVRLTRVRSAGLGVEVRVEGDTPDVRVPGPACRVALSNLLGNSVKYHTEEGSDRWVSVSSTVVEDRVLVAVEDNGPGIDPEIRDRVFEYRFRGASEVEGSGLGLSITQDSLEKVGGGVHLEEGRRGGARFVFELPIVPQTPRKPGSASGQSSQ